MLKKLSLLLVLLLCSVSFVVATDNVVPFYFRPILNGNLQEYVTYAYNITYSSDYACTDIIYSDTFSVTMDSRGEGFKLFDLYGMILPPKFLCEYRGGTLRNVHNITSGLFYNIYVAGNATISEKVKSKKFEYIGGDNTSYTKYGDPTDWPGSEKAIVFGNNPVSLGEGIITFLLYTQENGSNIVTQSGRNNSAGIWGNSLMIMPSQMANEKFGKNLTNATNCIKVCDRYNKTCRLDCDTSGYGASLMVQGGVHIWKDLFVDKSLRVDGGASFVDGNVNVIESNIHVFDSREEATTTNIGLIDLFHETFADADISPFEKVNQVGSDANNWITDSQADFCHTNPCARAEGGDGGAERVMEANYSMLNLSACNMSFYYGADNMDTEDLDNFSVFVSNNSVIGEFHLVFNRTIFAGDISDPPEFVVIKIPALLHNVSLATFRFVHKASVSAEETFLDNIKVNCTAGSERAVNITRYDSEIALDSGELRENSVVRSEYDIFWNGTSKRLVVPNLNLGDGLTQVNLTMVNADGNLGCCGMNNSYSFVCTPGACS